MRRANLFAAAAENAAAEVDRPGDGAGVSVGHHLDGVRGACVRAGGAGDARLKVMLGLATGVLGALERRLGVRRGGATRFEDSFKCLEHGALPYRSIGLCLRVAQ